MKVGDIISLKRPFYPSSLTTKAYQYGVVAGLIAAADSGAAAPPIEVVVSLYDPDTAEFYVDPLGSKALYIFYPDEIDLA